MRHADHRASGLTAERLRELLAYDADTGVFRWLVKRGRQAAGSAAGCVGADGGWLIRVDGVLHHAARLAWLWMTGAFPPVAVDHIDRNRLNNRWGNLRAATSAENSVNRDTMAWKRSGLPRGVSATKHGRFAAKIKIDYRPVHLGCFATAQEAYRAYLNACAAAGRAAFLPNVQASATPSEG